MLSTLNARADERVGIVKEEATARVGLMVVIDGGRLTRRHPDYGHPPEQFCPAQQHFKPSLSYIYFLIHTTDQPLKLGFF